MKYLAVLICSITLFAQNPYPDTLFLIDGRSYPCLVTSLNESGIGFIYSENLKESIIIQAVKRISMENHGIVYLSDYGFYSDIEQLDEFANLRFKKIADNKIIKGNDYISESPIIHGQNSRCLNRWSFGVLYVPYYTGIVYTIVRGSTYPPYPPNIYSSAVNETNMEVLLAYALLDELRITFDASYTATHFESRDENHTRQTGYEYDYGNFNKEELDLLDFNLGFKYYLKNLVMEKVSIYFLAGIGKQFAFAEEEYKSLFQDPDPIISTRDNQSEFMEDMNSPFHYNIGFGAEYFFNESLSLTSNIRFIYSMIEAKYNSRTVTEFETRTNSLEYKKSDFKTRVGLGFNFYF